MADGTQPLASEIRGLDGYGDGAGLLQIWLSPSFPAGSFAYSHGLERAVEMRAVEDRVTLEAWLVDIAKLGALRNDLILMAHAWRAAATVDVAALADLIELAEALATSAERRLETVTQGNAALVALIAAWPHPILTLIGTTGADVAYPAAIGLAAGAHDVPLDATLDAYAIAFTGNLVSAAIRLGVIGQTDGQRIQAALLPELRSIANRSEALTLDDLGSAVLIADIAAMQHETQYTRLFRT